MNDIQAMKLFDKGIVKDYDEFFDIGSRNGEPTGYRVIIEEKQIIMQKAIPRTTEPQPYGTIHQWIKARPIGRRVLIIGPDITGCQYYQGRTGNCTGKTMEGNLEVYPDDMGYTGPKSFYFKQNNITLIE